MSDTINPNPEPQASTSGPTPPPPPLPPRAESHPGVLDSLCAAMRDGANQAKTAAENAAPKVKAALADAAYWLGYGVSFASVFSVVTLKELTPATLKTGCREGAAAGRKAAEEFVTELKYSIPAPHPPAEPAAPPQAC